MVAATKNYLTFGPDVERIEADEEAVIAQLLDTMKRITPQQLFVTTMPIVRYTLKSTGYWSRHYAPE